MQTLSKKGARYSYTNNTGSAIPVADQSGNGVVVLDNSGSGATGKIGLAVTAIPIGGTGELAIGGPDERVNTVLKKVGDTFTDMQILYWDATNKRLTVTSSGNTKAGRSYGVYASSATVAQFILNEG